MFVVAIHQGVEARQVVKRIEPLIGG